jgi:hypothetical protein
VIEEREKLLTCLADEYKILQDKIDKIGGFRFTIKGWSLTLIVATLVAGTATKVSPNWIVSAVMAVFVMVFFVVEKKQTDLSRLFGERARHIESTVTGMLSRTPNGSRLDEFIWLGHAPGIAHLLREQGRERVRWGLSRFFPNFFRSSFWRKVREYLAADLWFYAIQIFVVCVAYFITPLESSKGNIPSIQVFENKGSVVGAREKPGENVDDATKGQTHKAQGKKPSSSRQP